MAMSGLTRIAEYIPATEVTVARTWDAMSLTSLGYTEENITGKQPLRTLDGIHMDTIQNKTNMMYIGMTFEEFTSWTENGELKHIHGWARCPEVEYIVLNSSPFKAVTTLLNYISVGTCRTQHLDTFIVATVQPSGHPAATSIGATVQHTCKFTRTKHGCRHKTSCPNIRFSSTPATTACSGST